MKLLHAFLLSWITTVLLLVTQMNILQWTGVKPTYVYQSEQIVIRNCSCAHKQDSSTIQASHKDSPVASSPVAGQKRTPCRVVRESYLLGEITLSDHVTAGEVRNEAVLSRVKPGGLYEPDDCVTEGATAVIIPYRDRERHLATLVYHLHAVLQRQRLRYGIYVAELAMPTQFNRGLLANTGFLTADSVADYDCYVIHDVDLLPSNDRNVYTCGASPRHLAANSSKYPHELPYIQYTGGVLAISRDHYRAVNGFSNMFFGWGGEDDDMFTRIQISNMTIERPAPDIGSYIALTHKKDTMNPPNPHRKALLQTSRYRKSIDGLTSMKYQRKALEFRQYYTWLLVECVESAYFNEFPYTEAEQRLLYKDQDADRNDIGSKYPKPPASVMIIHHRFNNQTVRKKAKANSVSIRRRYVGRATQSNTQSDKLTAKNKGSNRSVRSNSASRTVS